MPKAKKHWGRKGKSKKFWIAGAVNPEERGELREKIMRRYGPGAFTQRGTIRPEFLEKIATASRSSTETKQQARFAQRMRAIQAKKG